MCRIARRFGKRFVAVEWDADETLYARREVRETTPPGVSIDRVTGETEVGRSVMMETALAEDGGVTIAGPVFEEVPVGDHSAVVYEPGDVGDDTVAFHESAEFKQKL